MIKAYNFKNKALTPLKLIDLKDLKKAIWIDLISPTEEEKLYIENEFEVQLPTTEELHEIEISSRFYQHNHTLYGTITNITKANTDHPEAHLVMFILQGHYLISLRYSESVSLDTVFSSEKFTSTHPQQGSFLLSLLLDTVTEQLADILEYATHNIEEVAHSIFKYNYQPDGTSKIGIPNFKTIITQIGRNEDLLSKSREGLFTLTRMLDFCLQSSFYEKDEDQKPLHIITGDVKHLIEHGNFLSQKLTFLLDTTLGLINIEQSAIIKIVSVAAVVFLPPTLVASVYGMNFRHMPELEWMLGYPFAIFLMILAGFLPYKLFKYKGWL